MISLCTTVIVSYLKFIEWKNCLGSFICEIEDNVWMDGTSFVIAVVVAAAALVAAVGCEWKHLSNSLFISIASVLSHRRFSNGWTQVCVFVFVFVYASIFYNVRVHSWESYLRKNREWERECVCWNTNGGKSFINIIMILLYYTCTSFESYLFCLFDLVVSLCRCRYFCCYFLCVRVPLPVSLSRWRFFS